MRRPLDLGRTNTSSSALFEAAEVRDGITYRSTMPPGPERERRLQHVIEQQRDRAATLKGLVASLRRLVERHDPVQLVKSIAIPAGAGFQEPGNWQDDAAQTFSWPAKVEFLVGTALSMAPGTKDVSATTIERVRDLLVRIFDAAMAKHLVDSVDAGHGDNFALERVLFTLRLEHLTDRMPGYACHVELIDAEVFDRHRDRYVADLGFNPADVTRVVRRRVAHANDRADMLFRRARKAKPGSEASALAMIDLVMEMDELRNWVPRDVASITGVEEPELAAMLSYFSTTWGSQPEFRFPGDPNLALLRPCIVLADGSFFIPDPWSLPAAVHPRLAADAANSSGVLKRYRDHRAKGHQRLVGRTLERLFGNNALQEQHYAGTRGPGEVDALVASDWPLVVEAKARSLTPSGRRGAPKRVETVTKDVIEQALRQTARARAYILVEGGRRFADTEAGPEAEQLPVTIEGVTEIVVTFERMDPIATVGPALIGEDGRPVWITGLADLLMCTEILDDAASFHHYARTRATATAAGVHVTMESDALSGYLIDRLRSQLEQASTAPDVMIELGYSSATVNEYFTATEIGAESRKPTTGVPREVASSLSATVDQPGWSETADAVMTADEATWKRFKRYARRHRNGLFSLNERLQLELSSEGLTDDDNTLVLGLPPHR